jgi:hypothetical protein
LQIGPISKTNGYRQTARAAAGNGPSGPARSIVINRGQAYHLGAVRLQCEATPSVVMPGLDQYGLIVEQLEPIFAEHLDTRKG